MTKIRLEQVEETIKTINNFNTALKQLRDTNSEETDKENNEKTKKNEENHLENLENKDDINSKNENENKKIVNSLGFNSDTKKIIPLKILKKSYLLIIYIVCVLLGLLIPIFIYSNNMVIDTNELLLAENYIFGNLIKASMETVEIKCFMSNCQNKNKNISDYSNISNNELMLNIINGIKSFKKVNEFYNKNFLLNACGAVIDIEDDPIEYNKCLNDTLIISGNNTDSLIRVISDIVNNIKKEYFIRIENNKENIDTTTIKLDLFETDYFQLMERIFYKYILPVGNNFEKIVTSDLNNFLNNSKTLIIMLLLILIILIIIYCIFLRITLIRQLIHYLSISRCIMKIIPTSVIINTQELESWIENKYSF